MKTEAAYTPENSRSSNPFDKSVRVAVVHDFLYTYAGAEKVLEQILRIFPQADLFSLFDFLPADQRGFIQNKPVTTSFLQKMPFASRMHRMYLPLMPLAIEQLNLTGYDVVITSSYLAAKGVLTGPGQVHVCYCHSPVRFAWDMQNQYLGTTKGLLRSLKSMAARLILHYIRGWDSQNCNRIDAFASNSDFVAGRINKFYRRNATTIYPPVDIERFGLCTQRESYYLTASRLVSYKKIGLIVEAFGKTPERELIVIGEGPEFDRISSLAKPNIKIMGYQSAQRLTHYMQHARAFVFAAEEDFGIAPVEAQACGTPVIAFGRGGVTETVIDGVTGVLFDSQTVESLLSAVELFEAGTWSHEAIRANAQRFSVRNFQERFAEFVMQSYQASHARCTVPAQTSRPLQSKSTPSMAFSAARLNTLNTELGIGKAAGDKRTALPIEAENDQPRIAKVG